MAFILAEKTSYPPCQENMGSNVSEYTLWSTFLKYFASLKATRWDQKGRKEVNTELKGGQKFEMKKGHLEVRVLLFYVEC